MPTYMLQTSYTAESWAAMTKTPQDRSIVVRKLLERFGGTLHGCWMPVGDWDVVMIVEVPDAISASACIMAVSASGAFKGMKATQLLSMEDGVKAMSLAGGLEYRPPTQASAGA